MTNKIIGRLAFLPSLTPYSLWEVGHNVAHHGFNNLKGRDYVWAPLSRTEYESLSATRKILENVYRSRVGHGVYYFIEIWCKRLIYPSAQYVSAQRPAFVWDRLLVTLFAVVWLTTLGVVSISLETPLLTSFFFGFLLPFSLWNVLIGFVIYAHHIGPEVKWYNSRAAWLDDLAPCTATVHYELPFGFGTLLHRIMEHPAHHIDSSVPFYNLKEAQRALEKAFPELTGGENDSVGTNIQRRRVSASFTILTAIAGSALTA